MEGLDSHVIKRFFYKRQHQIDLSKRFMAVLKGGKGAPIALLIISLVTPASMHTKKTLSSHKQESVDDRNCCAAKDVSGHQSHSLVHDNT
jgi:hypothetical protein